MKIQKNIFQYILLNSKKNKTAIIFQGKKISYKSLNEIVSNLSISLIKIGIRKNDKIGLVLHNSLEFIYIMLAAAKIGAAIVPLNTTLPIPTIVSSLLFTKVKFLISWHSVLNKILLNNKFKRTFKNKTISVGSQIDNCRYFQDLIKKNKNYRKEINQAHFINKNYIISLTSGSTGSPKPIILTQKTKVLRALLVKKLYKLTSKDIVIAATPLEHSLSQRLVFLPLIMGATLVLLKNFTNKIWINEVKKNRVSFSILVASQIESIFKSKKNNLKKLNSLKTLVSTSAKLSENFKNKISLFSNCNFYEWYGASEIATATNLRLNKESKKIKSVGKACPGVKIKIINHKNHPVKYGTIGEISCKTTQIFSGYLNKKNETKNFFYKDYFKTGDLGYLDKDKYLYLVGRKKNMIIVGGINVYAEDVEQTIKKLPLIKDCCVIGVDDDRFGEAIVAIIIWKKGIKKDLNLLKNYCFENLADFQQPLSFVFTDKFPRNMLGKILRNDLKNRYIKSNLSNTISGLMKN